MRNRVSVIMMLVLLLGWGCANTLAASNFQLIDTFDYPIGWRPHDTDCSITRVAKSHLVREGEACMNLTFRVAPEDVGKKHWIIAARRDLRFMPPRVMRLWVRGSGACPLFLSLRDEVGIEGIWKLQPTNPNEWQQFTLQPEDAEWVSLTGDSRDAFTKPIVRVALFIRCESVKKAGRYEFLVDALEGAWSGARSPAPRLPRLIHSLDTLTNIHTAGCDAHIEHRPDYVVQGKSSLRVVWQIPDVTQDPRWMKVMFTPKPFDPPRAITFWVWPERTFPLSFSMDDADGTHIRWRLPSLKPGRWNFVRLELDEAGKWIAHAKRPFANVWADSPIVHMQLTLDRNNIEEPGEYALYLDDLRASYEADIFPADRVRGEGKLMEKNVFSDGETLLGCFAFSLPRRTGVSASLTLRREDGKQLLMVKRSWPTEVGQHQGAFMLSASALAVGDYSATVHVVDSEGKVVFDNTRQIHRVTPLERMNEFTLRFTSLRSKLSTLERLINRLESSGVKASYLRVARITIKRFIRVSMDFGYKGLFDRVERHLRFLEALADRAIQEAKQSKRIRVVPQENLSTLKVHDGNLYADNQPVVLIGSMHVPKGELAQIPEFGFNLIEGWQTVWPNCMWAVLPAPDRVKTSGVDVLRRNWEQARQLGVVQMFNPFLKFPPWAYEKYPDTAGYGPVQPGISKVWRHISRPKLCGTTFWQFCMEAPNTKKLIRTYYRVLLPKIATLPPPRIYNLMNEPTYRSRTTLYLDLFRKDLARKYSDIAKLNAIWQTNFKSFNDIRFPKPSNKAAWFDWLDFHQRQVTEFFKWLYTQVKLLDPQALVTNKSMDKSLFIPDHGVDMESQAEIFDLPGCDTSRDYTPDAELAMDCFGRERWLGKSLMVLDFFKSVAPEKPIADLEYHFAHSTSVKEYPEDYVRATLWQGFLHGMRLCNLWEFTTEWRAGTNVQYPPFARPKVAWAVGTTAIDLRRMSEFVSLFPPKEPEVALLYSRTSVFHEPERCFNETLTAYKALFFLDTPIGFVTERMINKGILSDESRSPKLLVVAGVRYVPDSVFDAILNYARNGGAVVILGKDALAFDQYERRRHRDVLLRYPTIHRFRAEWEQKLSYRFDALLTKLQVRRPVRVVGLDGKNAWGVESRTVMHNGQPLTYLINMLSNPVTVRLERLSPKGPVVDLITDETLQGPDITLKPLAVMLLTVNSSKTERRKL